MLSVHSLSKSYNINSVLNNISFSINPGECVGLLGPNGSGKSTLLRILIGEEHPDNGVVNYSPSHLRIAYLPQGFHPPTDFSIKDAIEQVLSSPETYQNRLSELASALTVEPDRQDLQSEYDTVLSQIEEINFGKITQVNLILKDVGLESVPRSLSIGKLSGGQKTRLSLALAMMQNPQLLLLDEPTNHLDLQMIEWLEAWLHEYISGGNNAALVVSHDRTFLDNTVSRILDIDPEQHTLKSYTGNYSEYISKYTRDKNRQWVAYKDQIAEIRRMKQDIARTKQHAVRVEMTTSSRQPGVRRIAKKVAAKAKSREKKLKRYLNSDERIDKPKAGWQMKLDFQEPIHRSKIVATSENLAIGYPGQSPLLVNINMDVQEGMRIALTGPNGSGKTTLLRTLVGELLPVNGSYKLGASVKLGYMSQEQHVFNPEWNALQTIQSQVAMEETEARSFLHFFLFNDDEPLRPIAELSYGERARLDLARLVVQGCNFLLLDEPINHLDIPSRERFEQALSQFQGTILAVVHDRFFIQRFATDVWFIEDNHIQQ